LASQVGHIFHGEHSGRKFLAMYRAQANLVTEISLLANQMYVSSAVHSVACVVTVNLFLSTHVHTPAQNMQQNFRNSQEPRTEGKSALPVRYDTFISVIRRLIIGQ